MSLDSSEFSHLRQGIFLSDLHLFSPRSRPTGIQEELTAFREPDQFIVLGGDIFDFRWSDKGGLGPTLQAAVAWLRELRNATGDCQLIFLAGNHDCHPQFLEQLELLARELPRFVWSEHWIQLADCLFLHGDILEADLCVHQLAEYRQKFHHAEDQSKTLHRSYDLAVAMRIHKIIPTIRHRPTKTCLRLLEFLNAFPKGERERIQRVFFGHTHQPILGAEHGGVTFYNPGAALKHMNYHAHKLSVGGES